MIRGTRIPPSLTTKHFSLQLPKRHIKSSFRCFSALNPALKTTLDKVVTSNKVVLFMKGNKDFPQCGFSNTVVQILKSLDVPFETLDILENELLRQALKEYSNWPTFPQLYIDGEFFGGCDITVVYADDTVIFEVFSTLTVNFKTSIVMGLMGIQV
ncbi:Monothiol glutaredoxin-s7 protein [Thalictrum thalictroides]|uniref:Monothiol glutaredoxin-s7 protein n=1 Tax=Thalictrum thalictroides TaxID=46969 RepID=A0A7J6WH63_THATH|nr:Monothiol glutaredoxin-s7 protein [Thalictrum thalictroides]